MPYYVIGPDPRPHVKVRDVILAGTRTRSAAAAEARRLTEKGAPCRIVYAPSRATALADTRRPLRWTGRRFRGRTGPMTAVVREGRVIATVSRQETLDWWLSTYPDATAHPVQRYYFADTHWPPTRCLPPETSPPPAAAADDDTLA